MIKPSPFIFSELRTLKRNQTGLNYDLRDIGITSTKQIKKSRSTKQIDATAFLETKNQKIKNIDEKLVIHQSQIHKNSQFIEQLNQNFMNLKEHLERERELTQNEERKNKLLRDQIERTNKILKSKNSKIEQFGKRIAELQKQNESLRPLLAKNEQLAKTIASLRSKLTSSQELIAEVKQSLLQRQKELLRQKEKMSSFDSIKLRQEDLDGQIAIKDDQIRNLKHTINELYLQKNKQVAERSVFEKRIEALVSQVENSKQMQLSLSSKLQTAQKKFNESKAKIERLQLEYKERQLKLKDREQEESNVKQLYNELKSKANTLQAEISEKGKLLEKKEAKIEKQGQKVKQLQNILGEGYKQKEKLKSLQQKVSLLRQKASSLQTVYCSITPQIQCPFGHELQSPVTIIPCGHNYCLGCKKGYMKDCMLCNGKLKIEAVYRNQLMDDIIGIVGGIRSVIQILK